MKFAFIFLVFISLPAFAEHDATYCGKVLDAQLGRDAFFEGHPQALLAVESRIKFGSSEPWDESYAAVYGLSQQQLAFIDRAVESSRKNGTRFCVKARWGGAAYSSRDIDSISLRTDNVHRIDYMSSFERNP